MKDLAAEIERCAREHGDIARSYERAGKAAGAAELRRVENLLWALLRGEGWSTVLTVKEVLKPVPATHCPGCDGAVQPNGYFEHQQYCPETTRYYATPLRVCGVCQQARHISESKQTCTACRRRASDAAHLPFPTLKELVQVGLDAMRAYRYQEAWTIWAELDATAPDWQLQVQHPISTTSLIQSRRGAATNLLTWMLSLCVPRKVLKDVATSLRDVPDALVRPSHLRSRIYQGEWIVARRAEQYARNVPGTSPSESYFDFGALEEDFDPADVRRERRRRELKKRGLL